jgi:hypothetical protein
MSAQGLTRNELETAVIKKALSDPSFKQRLLQNPKQVFQEELNAVHKGVQLPKDLNVRVLDESENTMYLVIPRAPGGVKAGELSDEELEAVAGGRELAASSGISSVSW